MKLTGYRSTFLAKMKHELGIVLLNSKATNVLSTHTETQMWRKTEEWCETSLACCCAFILILKSGKVHNSLLGAKNICEKAIEIVIIILISLYVSKQ